MAKITHVHLIKLGGSIITDKSKPYTVRTQVIKRLATEIAKYHRKMPDTHRLLIGHGQGSFAHIPASKYQTHHGFVNANSLYGAAVTHDVVQQLNRIVVDELIKQKIPAVSFLMSTAAVSHQKKLTKFAVSNLLTYLSQGFVPVTTGDVFVDDNQGCAIFSADTILPYLSLQLKKQNINTDLVHVTDVDGVLNVDGKTISEISQLKQLTIRNGTKVVADVTGGMKTKVAESLSLAKKGIAVSIISGLRLNNLWTYLSGGDWRGTKVIWKKK